MQSTTQQTGITFAVDPVAPAAERLTERRTHEAIKRTLGGPVESCCDYHGSVIARVDYQSLLAAVYTAFNEHRPLVLTPDAVWITIAQGVAHHMMANGERLRSRFVAHEGKLSLTFECDGWIAGSSENPWPEAFASWSEQIREHVGARVHDSLVCDFSTSGPVERAASQIVMMDIFERYFEYLMVGICGIPSVTLEGTTEDWSRLREKAAALEVFDLDWWLEHLLPICDQFVRASRGDVDLVHWQGICKLREEYGGDVINGWVAKLFPYLRAFINGPCNRRNPIFESGEGFQTLVAPPGLSRVPFVWKDRRTGATRHMEAIGGLVGVTQEPETMALRPKVGWAVREASRLDVLLARLAKDHTTFPGFSGEQEMYTPPDFGEFYSRTDGAEIVDRSGEMICRIVAAAEVEPLDWGEDEATEFLRGSRGPGDRIWQRFARLRDGSWLAINLDLNRRDPLPERPGMSRYDRRFSPICWGRDETQGCPGQNPVVAVSFTELLERMLGGERVEYWLDPQFVSHGDAEEFTRRGW